MCQSLANCHLCFLMPISLQLTIEQDHFFYGKCNLKLNFQNLWIYFFSDNLGSSTEFESFPYFSASPERGSGVHRIVGIIVKNPKLQCKSSDRYLNLDEILLNSDGIVSYNFFLTTWTKSVSDNFKSKNLKERIFGEFMIGPGQNHV